MFSVIRYCTCTVMIFLKSCVEHSTVLMCVHYTSCIDSYKALQKRSLQKPWYCLDVQSRVSYFANIIMCQICLFCKLHPLHHPLHSCPCPPNSLSSFFLLCFILSPSLPLISGECSMIILSLLVIWFSCYCTMMNLVIAFFTVAASLLYCMRMGCMVRYFPYTRFTVPFVPLVGVSLPYRVRVLFQYTPHGKVVSVHTVYSTRGLFLPSARHYSIIRMYSSTRRIVR
jgi:hypothetical protein